MEVLNLEIIPVLTCIFIDVARYKDGTGFEVLYILSLINLHAN